MLGYPAFWKGSIIHNMVWLIERVSQIQEELKQLFGLCGSSHPTERGISFKALHVIISFNSITMFMVNKQSISNDVRLLVKYIVLFLKCENHCQMEAGMQKGHCLEGHSHCLQKTRIKAFPITEI